MQNGTAGEKIDDDKKDDARKNVPETTNEAIGYEPEMGTVTGRISAACE